MEERVKDLSYFEDYQTEYLRNIKVFDAAYESKYVYVTTEKDDEYGYPVFRGVAYTFDKAFDNARHLYTINQGWRTDGYKYDFLLVNTQDIRDAWELNQSDYFNVDICRQIKSTNLYIALHTETGEIERICLFAIETYIGEQQ